MYIVLQVLGSVLVAVGAWPDRKKIRFPLILCGVVLATVGASMSQSEMERRLTEKDERITELTDEILDNVTGGSSFSYVELKPATGRPNGDFIALLIRNNGDHPAHYVQAKITDLGRDEEAASLGFHELNAYVPYPSSVWVKSTPFIAANSYFGSQVLPLSKREDIIWYVNISARNGIVHEKYKMRWIAGEPVQAVQVFKKREGSSIYDKIFEKIDDGYPMQGEEYITAVSQLDASHPLLPAPQP